MYPEQVREALAARHSGRPRAAAEAPSADATSDDLFKTISESYFLLRYGLAGLAFVFPIWLWLGAGSGYLQGSISAYYHFRDAGPPDFGAGEMRDVFVGVLCAIGSFLFFYKGYSRKEDRALNVAGLAAVLIATFPMDWPEEAGSFENSVHFASAVTFFLAIAYVCVCRSRDTLEILKDAQRRRWLKRVYALLGIAMVAMPLGIFLVHLLSDWVHLLPERTDESRWVLWAEVAGVYVFSFFWMAKSWELTLIERQ